MLTDWTFWGSGIALGIFGLWLMYKALFADRSRGRRRCPKCWYDMSGTEGLRCSECGYEAKTDRKLFKTRRRRGIATISLAFLITSLVIFARPLLREQQWHKLIPSTVLIQLTGSFESNWAFDALINRLGVMREINLDDYEYGTGYRFIHEQYMGTPKQIVLAPMKNDQWNEFRQSLLGILTESEDSALIIKSLVAIGTYGLIDQTCGSVFVDLLDHPNQDVRRLAAAGLCDESVRDSLCTPNVQKKLSPFIDSLDHNTRFVGLRTLSLCTLDDKAVRAAFEHAMTATDIYTRIYACVVLDEYCGSPEIAFEILKTMVADPSEGVRKRVLRALTSLSNRNLDTLSHVMAFEDDPSSSVRVSVILSITDDFRDNPQAIEHLLDFVDDEDENVRWTLVYVLENNSIDSDIALQILRPLCDDPDEFVRDDARSLLAQIEAKQ